MSTWISKILPAAALLALAACLPASDPPGGAASRFEGPPPLRMAIAAGQVIVAGPKGYCIDRDASRDEGGGSGLSVLSSCRGLGAPSGYGADPAKPAVLTAAVAAGPGEILVGPAAPDLTRFFQSTRGRAVLSRAGRAETVTLTEAFARDGVYFMHLSDGARFDWGMVQASYWRALLPLGGRMVTLSVLALPEAPLGREDGLELLENFIAAMRGATSAAGLATASAAQAAPLEKSAAAERVAAPPRAKRG